MDNRVHGRARDVTVGGSNIALMPQKLAKTRSKLGKIFYKQIQ